MIRTYSCTRSTPTDKRELRGGEAKRGTTQFHAYATAYMVSHGERFTLAMAYVLRDEPLKDVVRRLVHRVRKIGIRIRYLLLDREFFSRPVVCYLTGVHCPFLDAGGASRAVSEGSGQIPRRLEVLHLEEKRMGDACHGTQPPQLARRRHRESAGQHLRGLRQQSGGARGVTAGVPWCTRCGASAPPRRDGSAKRTGIVLGSRAATDR